MTAETVTVIAPIPMLLWCPECWERHIDVGEFATKPHHTHACQHCGFVWRPALVPTVGVQFLPGFLNPPVFTIQPETPNAPPFCHGESHVWRTDGVPGCKCGRYSQTEPNNSQLSGGRHK